MPSPALPSKNCCPWKHASTSTTINNNNEKRMGYEKQGDYQAVPTAPSSYSNDSIIFPPPKQRKGFKES